MAVKPVERPKRSGKWWIRIRWQLAPGRRFRKSKFIGAGEEGRDAAFSKAKLLNDAWTKFGADAMKLVEPEIPEPPRIPTVEEYGPGFVARATAAGLKRSTITMYSTTLRHHIYPVLGKLELDKINYKVLADFLSWKAEMKYSTTRFRKPLNDEEEEKARPKGTERRYSRDSIRIMAMTMRALMSEAVRDQIVQMNPVVGLSRFYRKKRKDREVQRAGVYMADELHRIEDQLAARNPEYHEFSLAMSREGMRIGEAMALTIHDIDWGRGTIIINKNLPAGMAEVEDSAKTDASDREIEFWSTDLRTALEAMLKRRRAEWLAKGEPAPETLFCEESGRHIDYSRFLKAWNRAQKLAGVRQRSPHSLRHTWASQMIAAGEDIASVSKHMGHANAGITLGLYTHFVPKKRRLEGTVLDRYRATIGQPEAEAG